MKLPHAKGKLAIVSFGLAVLGTLAFGQAKGQINELKLNETLERELTSGQTHEYQVTLKAGEFMQVRAEQKGIDVVLSIHSAAGEQLATMDSPNGQEGFETLSFIADKAGGYLVNVKRLEQKSNAQSGRYNITLTALRTPTALDRKRIEAERQFLAVSQGSLERVEDIQPRIEKYRALARVWTGLGAPYVSGLIEQSITGLEKLKVKVEAEFKQAIAAATELKLNEPVERELAKDETHHYRVALKAGEFMQVRAEQKGANVSLYIYSPDGHQLARMDSPNEDKGFETISFVAEETGSYLVRLDDMWKAREEQAGKYNITLIARRPHTARDLKRIQAEKGIWELRSTVGTIAQLKAMIDEYQAFLLVWRELKDDYIVGLIEETIAELKRSIRYKEESEAREKREQAAVKSRAELEARSNLAKTRRREREKANVNLPQLIIPTGHSTSLSSIAYSPDGKLIASVTGSALPRQVTAKHEKFIKLWDAVTGREMKTLIGHTSEVNSVAFSPVGKILASGSSDYTVKLWDVATGQELRSFDLGKVIHSVAFSPDGSVLAAGAYETIKLWDAATGEEIKTIKEGVGSVSSIAFSVDGKMIASGGYEKEIDLWDVATGQLLKRLTGHTAYIGSVAFSPNGKTLASASFDETARLWDITTGQELKSFKSKNGIAHSTAFSTDGKLLAFANGEEVMLWNTETGKELKNPEIQTVSAQALAFSPDRTTLAVGGYRSIHLVDLTTLREAKYIGGRTSGVKSLTFAPDGRSLVIRNSDGLKLWDVAKGQELKTIRRSLIADAVAFSPDGKIMAWDDWHVIRFREVATGKEFSTPEIHDVGLNVGSIIFSPNGKALAVVPGFIIDDANPSIKLLDLTSAYKLKILTGHTVRISSATFSADGKTFVSASWNETILWDVATGQNLRTIKSGSGPRFKAVAFSPDGKTIVSGAVDNTIKFWEAGTGQELKTLVGHASEIEEVAFLGNGKILASMSKDKEVKFWEAGSGREIKYDDVPGLRGRIFDNVISAPDGRLVRADIEGNYFVLRDVATEEDIASFIALDDIEPKGDNEDDDKARAPALVTDWAVVDSEGRWDASDGAQKLMYYSLATPEGPELIDFSQLKERYYEPNLLPKLLGHNKEPLRDVAQFRDVLLPPAVEAVEPKETKSTVRQVRLKNRNGGIGRVQVFVDGREYIEDARDEKLKANPTLKDYVLSFDLKDASVIPGRKPIVKIIAWNYDAKAKERYKGYISSRGTDVDYLPPEEKIEPPTLYAVIGGVSDYQGDSLDLSFASKDADDIYKAIQVGGKNLFGVERMKLKLLSNGGNKGGVLPTKENFRRAFAEFAREARPNDILFVYLAGHGITMNLGSDTYYYLTQEATTTNKEALSKDSQLLSSSTINSEELTQWHKSVKAKKQVLILDTCAAGAIGNEFRLAEKRELSSDAIRAIDNMRGRVGFHVLMGSAADAVSYEASQYGQGLLTYSLLQGMKGAALQPDGQIDVSVLFNYAANTVPVLARNVGGIQKPEIKIPEGGTSFAIGLIKTDDDKKQIPLALVKPVILRPNFQNQDEFDDNLRLGNLLRDRLREASYTVVRGGADGGLVFVEADDMPDAIRPLGRYVVEGDVVKVTLKLIRNSKPLSTINVEGDKKDLPALADKIFAAVVDEARKLSAPPASISQLGRRPWEYPPPPAMTTIPRTAGESLTVQIFE